MGLNYLPRASTCLNPALRLVCGRDWYAPHRVTERIPMRFVSLLCIFSVPIGAVMTYLCVQSLFQINSGTAGVAGQKLLRDKKRPPYML